MHSQLDPLFALAASCLVMVLALGWLLSRLGLFRGFWQGFWTGVFVRLFVGSARGRRGGGGCLSRLLALVVVILCAVVLARAFGLAH